MTTKTPETSPTSPLTSADLISGYQNLATLYKTEDLITATTEIRKQIDEVDQDQAFRLFQELLQERSSTMIELRRPIFESTDKLTELTQKTINERGSVIELEETPLEGATNLGRSIHSELHRHANEINESLNPERPEWKRVDAINQAIGAISTKLAPPTPAS